MFRWRFEQGGCGETQQHRHHLKVRLLAGLQGQSLRGRGEGLNQQLIREGLKQPTRRLLTLPCTAMAWATGISVSTFWTSVFARSVTSVRSKVDSAELTGADWTTDRK